MLNVKWQAVRNLGDHAGKPMVEIWSTSRDVHVELNSYWLIIRTVDGNELLLSVPTWRIIDVTRD